MKLSFDGEFFWVRCKFDERDAPMRAGFRFESGKGFYTQSPQVAARLREYADQSAKDELMRKLIAISPWSGGIPHPPSCTPDPWQIPAAHFALSRNRSYEALPPGMGKTVVAALVMNAIAAASPDVDEVFIYLCPPFLKLDVKEKLAPWRWHRTDPEIIPDSQLDGLLFELMLGVNPGSGRRNLFVDEAHRYKNPDANRTKRLFGSDGIPAIVDFFDKVVYLSGTPDPNRRPMELYPVLSKSAPETIHGMTRHNFGLRYCGAYPTTRGWKYTGASHVAELMDRVEKLFMLKLPKSLMNLPPVAQELVFIEEGLPPKLAAMDKNILRKLSPEDLMKGQLGGEDLHTSTYRRLLGVAKVPLSLLVIKAILEDTDESVVVVALHRDVISKLLKGLARYAPLVIDGSVLPKHRLAIAKLFQSDKTKRVIILNAQAGGVGIDLYKATRVVFVEFTWVPGDNEQARDRAWRRGQKNPVLCQFLVYKNSIDRVVLESLFKKQER